MASFFYSAAAAGLGRITNGSPAGSTSREHLLRRCSDVERRADTDGPGLVKRLLFINLMNEYGTLALGTDLPLQKFSDATINAGTIGAGAMEECVREVRAAVLGSHSPRLEEAY